MELVQGYVEEWEPVYEGQEASAGSLCRGCNSTFNKAMKNRVVGASVGLYGDQGRSIGPVVAILLSIWSP